MIRQLVIDTVADEIIEYARFDGKLISMMRTGTFVVADGIYLYFLEPMIDNQLYKTGGKIQMTAIQRAISKTLGLGISIYAVHTLAKYSKIRAVGKSEKTEFRRSLPNSFIEAGGVAVVNYVYDEYLRDKIGY